MSAPPARAYSGHSPAASQAQEPSGSRSPSAMRPTVACSSSLVTFMLRPSAASSLQAARSSGPQINWNPSPSDEAAPPSGCEGPSLSISPRTTTAASTRAAAASRASRRFTSDLGDGAVRRSRRISGYVGRLERARLSSPGSSSATTLEA
ncbi:MAG: hypothetical protein R2789_06770 [Microthrixaceae bacterium]